MPSTIAKRSIIVNGHKTSVSLEGPFWDVLRNIADEKQITMSAMVGAIDKDKLASNLSSQLRLFALNHVQRLVPPAPPMAV